MSNAYIYSYFNIGAPELLQSLNCFHQAQSLLRCDLLLSFLACHDLFLYLFYHILERCQSIVIFNDVRTKNETILQRL